MPGKPARFKTFRAYILLFAGLLVIGYEVVFEHNAQPVYVVAALLMMGVSVPLDLDDRLNWLRAFTITRTTEPDPDPDPEKVEVK